VWSSVGETLQLHADQSMCAVAGGMRTAIEALLLGSRVTLVEMRKRFTRHNLLHVHPFLFSTPLRFDQMANDFIISLRNRCG
jgi:hypothetical protein